MFVENGKVIKVVVVNSGQEVDKAPYAALTIEGLFKTIANYLREYPYEIQGAFDAVNGSPLYFAIDLDQLMVDDEITYNLGRVILD